MVQWHYVRLFLKLSDKHGLRSQADSTLREDRGYTLLATSTYPDQITSWGFPVLVTVKKSTTSPSLPRRQQPWRDLGIRPRGYVEDRNQIRLASETGSLQRESLNSKPPVSIGAPAVVCKQTDNITECTISVLCAIQRYYRNIRVLHIDNDNPIAWSNCYHADKNNKTLIYNKLSIDRMVKTYITIEQLYTLRVHHGY